MELKEHEIEISINNPSIEKTNEKCIQCGYCKRACLEESTVLKMYDISNVTKPICINCGICANICPTEAIHEKFDMYTVKNILKNNKDKIIVFSIAPAVRASIYEEFNVENKNQEGKIVSILKQLGANYIFDISSAADLTIIEEAKELEERINNNNKLPMFTSCCPAWVKYCEIFYKDLIGNLSTCKSPIMMEGAIVKTIFAKENKIKPENIIHITIAPCTAKKAEIKIESLNCANKYWNKKNIKDVDYVLTTRELINLIKEYNLDFNKMEDMPFDNLSSPSSSGVMFGNSGGVMEASLRTLYYNLTGNNLKDDDLIFSDIRGLKGLKETTIIINDKEYKFAVINGIKNAKPILDKIASKEIYYDFIEVMTCNGGCINGGGQPKMTILEATEKKEKRMNILYMEDIIRKTRLCHENLDIKNLYDKFLISPNSELSKYLLHRTYEDKSYLMGGIK